MNKKPGEVVQAAINGDADELKAIIRRTVDEKGPSGRTALMVASLHGHNKVLNQLLVFGAAPDIGDENQNTALHEACWQGSLETVQILLEHGANINVRNKDGDSPLHSAAHGCNLEVVELLLEEGAEVNMKNKNRQTPKEKLQEAAKSARYDEQEAKAIVDCLHDWRVGKPVTKKKSAISQKEENLESLKEIKQNVADMNAGVKLLVEKIESLGLELKTTTAKLAVTEERANQYKSQLQELQEGVSVMHGDLQKNGTNADNKLKKLIEATEKIFENMCQDTNFNDKVFHGMFHDVAVAVGAKRDLWKDLAKNLFEGYPQSFVHDQINQIMATYDTEYNRAFECLLKWKIIVATWVHKIGPLKSAIGKIGVDNKQKLYDKMDQRVDEHTLRSHEEPRGSLTERGLMEIAKQLGRQWRDLGVQLEFTTPQLDDFRDSYPNSDERNHHMLVEWVQREPGFNDIKLGRLAEALKMSGRTDLAVRLHL